MTTFSELPLSSALQRVHLREFASWHQHESDGVARWFPIQALNDGNEKRQCLDSSCVGGPNDVATVESRRDRTFLKKTECSRCLGPWRHGARHSVSEV